MPALRHTGPRLRPVREPVALDHGHPVDVTGQDLRREHPRETPTHDDRVPPTPTTVHAPTARSLGRVHQSTPLPCSSRRDQASIVPLHRAG